VTVYLAGKEASPHQKLSMRIVASMTTTPSRIAQIRPAIQSVLSQSVPVDHLELNVPHYSVRTGEMYVIPDWMDNIDRLKIFRIDGDCGPITKIAPTLRRYRGNKETFLWSVDDDCAYPENQLELLCRAHDPNKYRILSRHGGGIDADGNVQMWYGASEVSMFDGFGGVLYPPDCTGDDFDTYVKATSANPDCRSSDDMVLSLYFRQRGVPIYLYNKPDEAPFMNPGWMPYAKNDALRLSVGGDWKPIYKRVINFVTALKFADNE
jgi:hypothetical protein